MINLNITFALKPDQSPELNASFVAAFIEALEAKGYSLQGEQVKPVKSPAIAQERGPLEIQYIESRGMKRMRVPPTWNGTREEYAQHMLSGNSPSVESDDSPNADPLDVFHE